MRMAWDDKQIVKTQFDEIMAKTLPKYDNAYIHDAWDDEGKNLCAFGLDTEYPNGEILYGGIAVFYYFEEDDSDAPIDPEDIWDEDYVEPEKDGFLTQIWLHLINIFDDNDESEKALNKLLTALSKLGDFMIADWRTGFIEKLSNRENIMKNYTITKP